METKRQRDQNRGGEEGAPPRDVSRRAREQIRARGGGPREGEQWFLVKRGRGGRGQGGGGGGGGRRWKSLDNERVENEENE